ncbi:flavin reductase [Actinomadura logoneensis]|uniref:Flavin reductase n=1 Tax=Actinomadura logoneensis TaxID=2293572 RepID=A0A372JIJ5_9ACTN|nr:flavin reductase family protein [Actinomadura logoneensis]RFU39835.1 flavin reductase [Actinomadura logoneensis]
MHRSPDGPTANGAAPNGTASAAAAEASGAAGTRPDGGVTDIDGARFRAVLGRFATGVVAITGIDAGSGRPTGLAANSFTSVSLDPPLVAFCVAHTSTTWPRLRDAGRLCINILSEPQLEVCKRLALKGGDKFADITWTGSPGGGPVIEGALAWIEVSVENEHVAGDHVIVVARVHHLDKHHEGEPLLFYKGAYGSFA